MPTSVTPTDDRLFPKLDDADLAHIRPLGKREEYAGGQAIVRHSTDDIDLLVIESGRVDIIDPNAKSIIVTHGPRDFIGDIDLLTRRPVIYDAVARGDDGGPTVVLRVPGECLRRVLALVPTLGEKFIDAFQLRRERAAAGGAYGMRVVGPNGCPKTNEAREFLQKNFVPYEWVDTGTPEGGQTLGRLGGARDDGTCSIEDHGLPLVECGDGKVLHGPSIHDLAVASGVWRGCPDEDVDLCIVGGGPAGLAAAVYAASEGLNTVVVDRVGPGGQAGLSSRIENFIGFPAGLTGTELATRAVLQMMKFGARLITPVGVVGLDVASGPGEIHRVKLDCGATIKARCVLAATGVKWKRLDAENARRFERVGVYYACTVVEAEPHAGEDVGVIGGGNSAGQAAMYLAERGGGRTVHLLLRSPLGPGMSEYLIERIRGTKNIVVHEGVVVSTVHGDRSMDGVDVKCCDGGEIRRMACCALYVFIGAEPHADWLPANVARDEKGYVLTGSAVVDAGQWPIGDHRPPCPLETSIPGILAGGDVRAGTTKRVGFAVGDGSMAVTCVHALRAAVR